MKRVLTIGVDPAIVDFSQWPGQSAETLHARIGAEKVRLIGLGYEVTSCFVDLGATAESVVVQALSAAPFNCVLIGAGIRTSEDSFLLFEKLINVVHRHAPKCTHLLQHQSIGHDRRSAALGLTPENEDRIPVRRPWIMATMDEHSYICAL